MRYIYKFFPMFFIEWYAKKFCERVVYGSAIYAIAYCDDKNICLIQVDRGGDL